MKYLKYLFIVLILSSLAMQSCDEFSELEVDPNRPTNAPASNILNGVLQNFYTNAWTLEQRYNQFWCINYNYYGTNEYWTGAANTDFTRVKNVIKMEEEALRGGADAVNAYSALGKFFRAYHFINTSQKVGDIPLSEALQGLESPTPKYNTQKEVYVQALKWLDEANTEMEQVIAKGGRADGDWFYNGDMNKWRKLVNTYKLRVLMSLSKKVGEADLGIQAKFAEVLNNPTKFPIMTSNADNLQFQPVANNSSFYYRKNPNNFGFDALRENTSKLYIDLLKERKDPRLFIVAEPAEALVAGGLKETDFNAFEGASTGESLDDMAFKAQKGEYSLISRKRFYATFTGEPVIQVGYAEMCFNIAEGINRGWASGDAESFYRKGIEASMAFYGIATGALNVQFAIPGTALGNFNTFTVDVNLDTYYNQPVVKYAGNNADGLSQILTQKYLAFAQNSDLEAYYNYRRTGIPAFLTGVGVGNSSRIPRRYRYPSSEFTINGANLSEALTRQFGAANRDDINDDLWIVK